MNERLGRLAALMVALALIAAACSGSDDSTDTDDTSGDDTTVDESEDTTDDTSEVEEPTATTEGALAGLTVVDDSTFTVELTTADPEFPLRLSYPAFYPLPSVAFEDPAAFEEAPIGNGAFMMDGAWDHDIAITVVPYTDYAGDDPADVDSLTYNIYEDAVTTGYLDLQAGTNDFVKTIPAEQIAAAKD